MVIFEVFNLVFDDNGSFPINLDFGGKDGKYGEVISPSNYNSSLLSGSERLVNDQGLQSMPVGDLFFKLSTSRNKYEILLLDKYKT